MTSQYNRYRATDLDLPEKTWAWNMYGVGEENIGKDGKPEQLPVPKPGTNQLLVRVDSVGLCFSIVKLIRMEKDHPKLYNRDLTKEPTRLGHEKRRSPLLSWERNCRGKYCCQVYYAPRDAEPCRPETTGRPG